MLDTYSFNEAYHQGHCEGYSEGYELGFSKGYKERENEIRELTDQVTLLNETLDLARTEATEKVLNVLLKDFHGRLSNDELRLIRERI